MSFYTKRKVLYKLEKFCTLGMLVFFQFLVWIYFRAVAVASNGPTFRHRRHIKTALCEAGGLGRTGAWHPDAKMCAMHCAPCLASEVYMSFYSLRKVGEVEHLETTSLCCKNSVSHWPEASSPCATIGSLGSNEEVPVTLPLILRDTNDYRSHWLAWLSGGVVILDQNVPMSHRPWLMGCQVCYNGAHWPNVLTYCSFVPLLTRNCLFFISVISRHCNLQHLSLQRMTTSEARSEEALAATSTNAPTEMEFLELERGGRPKSDRGEESELCSLVGVVSLLEQSLRWKGRGPLGQRAVWDDYD